MKPKKVNTKVYKEELMSCNNNKIKLIIARENKTIKPKHQNPFIKRSVKLLPLDEHDKRISYYDTIRFGKYKGRTGKQVLEVNKKHLKRLSADKTIIFCPIMIARLKN